MAPEFVTNDFLEICLSGNLKTKVNVRDYSASNVQVSNNNFCGILLRLAVTYSTAERDEDKHLSLIAKICPEDQAVVEVLNMLNCFGTELEVYGGILPEFLKLGYLLKIAPNLISIPPSPRPTIILEDLKPLGYSLHNEGKLLDLEHCLLVIDKVAYLHAASIAAREKTPSLYDKFDKSMYSENAVVSLGISVCSASLNELCHRTPGLRKYAGKITAEKIAKKLYSTIKPSEKLNVFNHGDLRADNIMFRYDPEGILTDAIMIDYQFSVYGSPAIDLNFFLVASTTVDVKTSGRDVILSYYYNQLVRNLCRLRVQVPLPTMDQFKEEIETFSIYGLMTALITLPLFLGEVRPDATLFNYFSDNGEDSFRNSCFRSDEYLNQLKVLLPMYDSLGLFD